MASMDIVLFYKEQLRVNLESSSFNRYTVRPSYEKTTHKTVRTSLAKTVVDNVDKDRHTFKQLQDSSNPFTKRPLLQPTRHLHVTVSIHSLVYCENVVCLCTRFHTLDRSSEKMRAPNERTALAVSLSCGSGLFCWVESLCYC
jgi:hypothetical protein